MAETSFDKAEPEPVKHRDQSKSESALPKDFEAQPIADFELGKRKDREPSGVSLDNADPRKKHRMFVPDNLIQQINIVGVLLGPKGSTIQALESKCGAKISIRGKGSSKDGHKESDSDQPLHLLIEGDDETIEHAKNEIEAIFNDPESARMAGNNVSNSSRMQSRQIFIPEKVSSEMNILGVLIGPRGSTLRGMQDKTGAKISIRGRGSSKDPKSDLDPDQSLHVLIEGNESSIEVASREIESIINDPEKANQLKAQQMNELNMIKRSMGYNVGRRRGSSGYNQFNEPNMYNDPPGNYGMMHPMGRPFMGAPMGGAGYDNYGGAYGGMRGMGPPPRMIGGYGQPPIDELNIFVPNTIMGAVMGRQNTNMQRIQAEFAVDVHVQRPKNPQGNNYTVPMIIRGPRQNIEAARDEIMQKVSGKKKLQPDNRRRPKTENTNLNEISVIYAVPNDRVGLVIGKGGQNVKSLQMKTGTTVKIPTEADQANPNMRSLTICGSTQAGIDTAIQEIQGIVSGGTGARGNGGGSTYTLQIPSDKIGLVLGKGGSTVKDIHLRTGATIRIDTPPPGESQNSQPTRSVMIYGPQDGCDRAKWEIEQIILLGKDIPGGNYEEVLASGGYPGPGLVDPYRKAYETQGSSYQPPVQYPAQVAKSQYSNASNPSQVTSYPHQSFPAQYSQPQNATQPYRAAAPTPPNGQQQPNYAGSQISKPPSQFPNPAVQYAAQGQYPQNGAQQQQPPQYYSQQSQGPSHYGTHANPNVHAQSQFNNSQTQMYQHGGQTAARVPSAPPTYERTQYYTQFWQYAQYYGEKIAREQYGLWSPPVGTPPPPGVILPAPGQEHPAPTK